MGPGFDHRADVVPARYTLLLKAGADAGDVVFGQGFAQQGGVKRERNADRDLWDILRRGRRESTLRADSSNRPMER
jgi:hypothetical protein